MYCNACGQSIAEDGRFCSHCGNVVGIPPTPKKLMRSRADRKIGGVCSGLAQYLDLDISLVRVLWFFITLACGIFPGIVAYVLGWIIIPEEPLLLASGDVATAGDELIRWRDGRLAHPAARRPGGDARRSITLGI
jgi:phage shock protein C